MTLVGIDIDVVSPSGDGSVRVVGHLAGADLPDQEALETLVRPGTTIAWATSPPPRPPPRPPCCCCRKPSATFLAPVQQALVGKAFMLGTSPLAESLGEQVMHPSLFLADDPLRDGRPGSRPVDDEGVPSFACSLIEGGVVRRCIYDLETGALAGRPSTGHGRRSTFGKAQPAFSNLVMQAESMISTALLAPMGDGLLVDCRGRRHRRQFPVRHLHASRGAGLPGAGWRGDRSGRGGRDRRERVRGPGLRSAASAGMRAGSGAPCCRHCCCKG